MNARRIMGFAADKVPLDMFETTLWTVKDVCGAIRKVADGEKDAGRSRKHSGRTVLGAWATSEVIERAVDGTAGFVENDGGALCTLCPKTLNGTVAAL